MLITLDEVVDLLGNQDLYNEAATIEPLIANFSNWFCRKYNNYFHTRNWIKTNGIAFEADNTITEANDSLLDDQIEFADGMDFHVFGSILNDGVYAADTVAVGTITTEDMFTVVDEDFTTTIRIIRMAWPKGLKFWAAKAIEWDLQQTPGMLEVSGTKDDLAKYPQGILDEFRSYSKLKTIY